VTSIRKTLDSRYDDLKSGRIKPIDGEEAFTKLREKSADDLADEPPSLSSIRTSLPTHLSRVPFGSWRCFTVAEIRGSWQRFSGIENRSRDHRIERDRRQGKK
jgi:hypothetical protein